MLASNARVHLTHMNATQVHASALKGHSDRVAISHFCCP